MSRTILIVAILAAAIAGMIYLIIAPALADGYRRQAYVQKVVSRRRLYRRVEDDPPRRHCLGPVRGVGTQWVGEEGALNAARKDWMERTRYDHGETYLDLSHAEDFEKRCGRTSVGEVAGQVLYRCEIVARPCKADFEKQEGQR